jgi:hypothetical protein
MIVGAMSGDKKGPDALQKIIEDFSPETIIIQKPEVKLKKSDKTQFIPGLSKKTTEIIREVSQIMREREGYEHTVSRIYQKNNPNTTIITGCVHPDYRNASELLERLGVENLTGDTESRKKYLKLYHSTRKALESKQRKIDTIYNLNVLKNYDSFMGEYSNCFSSIKYEDSTLSQRDFNLLRDLSAYTHFSRDHLIQMIQQYSQNTPTLAIIDIFNLLPCIESLNYLKPQVSTLRQKLFTLSKKGTQKSKTSFSLNTIEKIRFDSFPTQKDKNKYEKIYLKSNTITGLQKLIGTTTTNSYSMISVKPYTSSNTAFRYLEAILDDSIIEHLCDENLDLDNGFIPLIRTYNLDLKVDLKAIKYFEKLEYHRARTYRTILEMVNQGNLTDEKKEEYTKALTEINSKNNPLYSYESLLSFSNLSLMDSSPNSYLKNFLFNLISKEKYTKIQTEHTDLKNLLNLVLGIKKEAYKPVESDIEKRIKRIYDISNQPDKSEFLEVSSSMIQESPIVVMPKSSSTERVVKINSNLDNLISFLKIDNKKEIKSQIDYLRLTSTDISTQNQVLPNPLKVLFPQINTSGTFESSTLKGFSFLSTFDITTKFPENSEENNAFLRSYSEFIKLKKLFLKESESVLTIRNPLDNSEIFNLLLPLIILEKTIDLETTSFTEREYFKNPYSLREKAYSIPSSLENSNILNAADKEYLVRVYEGLHPSLIENSVEVNHKTLLHGNLYSPNMSSYHLNYPIGTRFLDPRGIKNSWDLEASLFSGVFTENEIFQSYGILKKICASYYQWEFDYIQNSKNNLKEVNLSNLIRGVIAYASFGEEKLTSNYLQKTKVIMDLM